MDIFFNWSLNYKRIGPAEILRPSIKTRQGIRVDAEAHLRVKYSPGTYTDNTTCNGIFKYMFDFYEQKLNKVIPFIATSRWVGELLFQYDQSGLISRLYKINKLSQNDHQQWKSIGALYRQSLDLLCEKIAAIGEIDKLTTLWQAQIPELEQALVFAEKCVEYAEVSNYTHIVVPEATKIVIHPENSDPYLEHEVNAELDEQIRRYFFINHREITIRKKYLDNSFDPFDHLFHASILNEPMQRTFGIDYNQYLAIVTIGPTSLPPATSYNNVPMTLKETLISGIAGETGLSKLIVERVINSLVLDTTTPRQVWNSRQLNRINKQPFLQFQSKGRNVLMWSRSKVEDFLTLLNSDLIFNKPPQTWTNSSLVSGVTKISNSAGKWFEKSVIQQLELLGFCGRRIKPKTFDEFPEVKFDCGEIDFLAYHPVTNIIVVFEFKMFETGFDARGIRQVRSSFLESKDAYVTTFAKKISWVNSNVEFVKTFLTTQCHAAIASEPHSLQAAFITFYPTLMNVFFQYPLCKSLVQFIEDFREKGEWPY